MAVTWLHVSDFHLSDKGPYNQEVILNALVSSVKRFGTEGHKPDLIFATGDIAQNGKAQEYAYATEFFNALLDAAGLEKERLFIVPGNHDVDRKMGKGLARTLDSNDDADEYFDLKTSLPHLTQKLQAFSAWYNEYFKGIRTFPTDTTCSQVEVIPIRKTRIAVLPLNSALFCIDDNDHNKLFIGRRCLDSAVKQLQSQVEADLKIALLHHPLDWLSSIERANINATLGAAVDLVLQGHYHETETEGIASANGGYLKLAAGAAYQTRQHPNSAMYATFEGNHVEIFPIHYVDKPREIWTLDTGIFPAPSYTNTFQIKGFDSSGSPQQPSGNQNADKNQLKYESYKAIIKVELGYIRMLGLPGVESIKVNLNDDTFVPLRLSDRQESDNKEKNNPQGNEHILYPDKIMKRAFQDRRGRRMLLVIGDPGAGKTTLLKYYALCALENYKRLGFTEPVNVFYIPLRELVRDKEGDYISLPANLANWAKKHQQTIATDVFTDWLNSGTSLVLLDGLDEISNTADRIEVCKWIDNVWAGFTKAFFVVTSRSTGYNKEEGIELECDYERADVQDFTPDQQERFLKKWFTAAFLKEPCEEGFDEAGWQEKQTKEADQRTQTIVAYLKAEKNKGLRQLAAIPMILQIMAILWKDREYMPESRVELYDAALNYLLEFRDKRRNIRPLLSASDARQVLAPISLWMQKTLKKNEVAKSDMHFAMQKLLDTLNTPETPPAAEAFCNYLVKRSGLLIENAGKEYFFRHKSFREYLAGVQLKEDRPYDQLNELVTHFGEDWWEEPLRFFISSVDANVFDVFMQKLFDAQVSDAMTQKQQLLLQTIIEEAKQKKVDALCTKLLDPATSESRQRVILDCLKAIGKPGALVALQEFRGKKLAINEDVADRAEEVIRALGGQPFCFDTEKSGCDITRSFRNSNEQDAEYILIQGGSYKYSVTEKIVRVPDLYVAKYPVTNQLYRSFITSLQTQASGHDSSVLPFVFSSELNAIAKNNSWGPDFAIYLNKGKGDLASLFRSKFDEDRKFGGYDQPVVGVSWYAARAYCLWLSLLGCETNRYRLPTEIEWEWAAGARQGTTGMKVRQYPWLEVKGKATSKLLNYDGNVGATTPVGSYPEGATPEGLYDMAGNVYEWMENKYDEGNQLYALRGGSWDVSNVNLRCSYRNFNYPFLKENNYGFRVIRSSHSLRTHEKNAEMESLYKRTLSFVEQSLDNEHPVVTALLANIGGSLQDQGKYTEAVSYYKRELSIVEKSMGSEYPALSTLLTNIGGSLQDQGKYTEAEPYYKRALSILEKSLGNEPAITTSLNNLAGLLRSQGNYDEAELLYNRAIKIVEKSFGNKHPAIVTSLNNLAGLLRVQDKYVEAKLLNDRARSITADLLPISVPPDLVSACLKGECVAFVGSGIGARAGLPTWVEFVSGLLAEADTFDIMDKKSLDLQRTALQEGEINAVADNLVRAFGFENKLLLDYYNRVHTSRGALPRSYHLLRTIPFAAILTSNYDNLLDQVLDDSDYRCDLTLNKSERLFAHIAKRSTPFLLKLYGDLRRPEEPPILAPTEYQKFVYNNRGFARFMQGLFFKRTLLFIGTSLDGLTDYLSVFKFGSEVLRPHYALVAVTGRGWEVTANTLKSRYNISVIPFRPSKGFIEVDIFLEELAQSVAQRKRDSKYNPVDPIGPKLKKIVLEDIGPFEKLELDFQENWKILLGDNGVGKTTILKALAVAFVGDTALHLAAPLLRVGKSIGRIRIVTFENPNGYLVEIQKVGSGVDIVSYSGNAIELEGLLVLGFPPLRATTWLKIKGPIFDNNWKGPNMKDVEPLISGIPDIRMDDLKQWVVNEEVSSCAEGTSQIDRNRKKELLKKFFDIVNILIDQSIKEFEVTSDFQVQVETNDGRIPIESLSQGMTSLLSWVGILLQRLYEVHDEIEDPTQEYALVLMDEIDAHLHPKWQQTLITKLKNIFPNVQFIASTHSPLVVAGMPVSQIVRFERNKEGQVEIAHVDEDMSIGRTDQVLTGDLFGLKTTMSLDEETEKIMEEYKRLLAIRKRNNNEDNRFYELHDLLIDRLPPTPESKPERRAYELATYVLNAISRNNSVKELKEDLLKELNKVGKSMKWEGFYEDN